MSTIVNQSFFIREIELPNLTHASDLERLTNSILKYEPQCLLKILGYPLYKLFGTESSTRMTELLSGGEYNDGEGNLRKWQGIVHNTTISLIANYVYFYIKSDKAIHTSGTGSSTSKSEAGNAISPSPQMCAAWNFFSAETFDMICFLWLKKIDGVRVYPEFSYAQFLETKRFSSFIDDVFQF